MCCKHSVWGHKILVFLLSFVMHLRNWPNGLYIRLNHPVTLILMNFTSFNGSVLKNCKCFRNPTWTDSCVFKWSKIIFVRKGHLLKFSYMHIIYILYSCAIYTITMHAANPTFGKHHLKTQTREIKCLLP